MLRIFLIINLIITVFFIASLCKGEERYITEKQANCICGRMRQDVELNTKYLWGGKDPTPGKGKDCSGSAFSYYWACGVWWIVYKTSKGMAAGKDGYKDFPEDKKENIRRMSYIFTTLQSKRPEGHIQIALEPYNKEGFKVFHASSSKGLMFVTIKPDGKDYFWPKITRIRQTMCLEKPW